MKKYEIRVETTIVQIYNVEAIDEDDAEQKHAEGLSVEDENKYFENCQDEVRETNE